MSEKQTIVRIYETGEQFVFPAGTPRDVVVSEMTAWERDGTFPPSAIPDRETFTERASRVGRQAVDQSTVKLRVNETGDTLLIPADLPEEDYDTTVSEFLAQRPADAPPGTYSVGIPDTSSFGRNFVRGAGRLRAAATGQDTAETLSEFGDAVVDNVSAANLNLVSSIPGGRPLVQALSGVSDEDYDRVLQEYVEGPGTGLSSIAGRMAAEGMIANRLMRLPGVGRTDLSLAPRVLRDAAVAGTAVGLSDLSRGESLADAGLSSLIGAGFGGVGSAVLGLGGMGLRRLFGSADDGADALAERAMQGAPDEVDARLQQMMDRADEMAEAGVDVSPAMVMDDLDLGRAREFVEGNPQAQRVVAEADEAVDREVAEQARAAFVREAPEIVTPARMAQIAREAMDSVMGRLEDAPVTLNRDLAQRIMDSPVKARLSQRTRSVIEEAFGDDAADVVLPLARANTVLRVLDQQIERSRKTGADRYELLDLRNQVQGLADQASEPFARARQQALDAMEEARIATPDRVRLMDQRAEQAVRDAARGSGAAASLDAGDFQLLLDTRVPAAVGPTTMRRALDALQRNNPVILTAEESTNLLRALRLEMRRTEGLTDVKRKELSSLYNNVRRQVSGNQRLDAALAGAEEADAAIRSQRTQPVGDAARAANEAVERAVENSPDAVIRLPGALRQQIARLTRNRAFDNDARRRIQRAVSEARDESTVTLRTVDDMRRIISDTLNNPGPDVPVDDLRALRDELVGLAPDEYARAVQTFAKEMDATRGFENIGRRVLTEGQEEFSARLDEASPEARRGAVSGGVQTIADQVAGNPRTGARRLIENPSTRANISRLLGPEALERIASRASRIQQAANNIRRLRPRNPEAPVSEQMAASALEFAAAFAPTGRAGPAFQLAALRNMFRTLDVPERAAERFAELLTDRSEGAVRRFADSLTRQRDRVKFANAMTAIAAVSSASTLEGVAE